MPPQWHDFAPENIRRAEQEREASIRLRGMICSTLSQTSADMREQADRVEEALSRRIAETEEATRRLEDELKAVSICAPCIETLFHTTYYHYNALPARPLLIRLVMRRSFLIVLFLNSLLLSPTSF